MLPPKEHTLLSFWGHGKGHRKTVRVPASSRRGRQEHYIAVPMAKQQGQFDIEAIVGDRPASPGQGAAHSVLDRIEMQCELFCGKRVARAGVEEDSKCFPQ